MGSECAAGVCVRLNAGLPLNMTVDVYQTNEEGTYLFLPQGEPFSSVPRSVLDTIGLSEFLNTVELASEVKDGKRSEILTELEKQRYSVHKARFKVAERG